MNVKICDVSVVRLVEKEILSIDVRPNVIFTIKDYDQLIDAAFLMGRGKKYFSILNFGGETTISNEVLNFCSSHSGSILKSAEAIVVPSKNKFEELSLSMHEIDTFKPTRIFNNLNDAKAWIDEMKLKETRL